MQDEDWGLHNGNGRERHAQLAQDFPGEGKTAAAK